MDRIALPKSPLGRLIQKIMEIFLKFYFITLGSLRGRFYSRTDCMLITLPPSFLYLPSPQFPRVPFVSLQCFWFPWQLYVHSCLYQYKTWEPQVTESVCYSSTGKNTAGSVCVVHAELGSGVEAREENHVLNSVVTLSLSPS